MRGGREFHHIYADEKRSYRQSTRCPNQFDWGNTPSTTTAPGGGGASYPDGYYFNLRGKILIIDFDGPYEDDKTPTPATKKLEKKVLGTFREF